MRFDDINQADALAHLTTVNDWVRLSVSLLEANPIFLGHGTDNTWDEALSLILGTLSLPIDSNPQILHATLLPSEREQCMVSLRLRFKERLPVPYIHNEAWFAGLSFFVDQRVIIPRSPMAELIESHFQPWIADDAIQSVLDLCTGSGCIGIATALYLPDVTVDCVDLSPDALAVAKENLEEYELAERVSLIKSDLFDALGDKQYDVILSNPPYVADANVTELPAEYAHEPTMSLASGEDGLMHVKRILKDAHRYLSDQGLIIVEVGEAQDALVAAYPEVPFTWLQFEHGGDGVFVLTKQELLESQVHFSS